MTSRLAEPAATTLDVAITVIRLMPAAIAHVEAEPTLRNGIEEHAAADAEQRAEAAGHGARDHDCRGVTIRMDMGV